MSSHTKGIKRTSTPRPLIIQYNILNEVHQYHCLGSNTIVYNSVLKPNIDHNMFAYNIQNSKRHSLTSNHNAAKAKHSHRNSKIKSCLQRSSYCSNYNFSSVSPPPLSPYSQPSWREWNDLYSSSPSISSNEYDSDNEPLGLILNRPRSLLSDSTEEDDADLVPIAKLSNMFPHQHLSAAEKYKAKVKAKLDMNN